MSTGASLGEVHCRNLHCHFCRYVCSLCGKEHGYYKALERCQARHRERFHYPCTLCDKKYLDKLS